MTELKGVIHISEEGAMVKNNQRVMATDDHLYHDPNPAQSHRHRLRGELASHPHFEKLYKPPF